MHVPFPCGAQRISLGGRNHPRRQQSKARRLSWFLEAGATTDTEGGDDVGRIDMVLVSNKPVQGAPMEWCALEVQAVYFSGDAMRGEFKAFADETVDWIIFRQAAPSRSRL